MMHLAKWITYFVLLFPGLIFIWSLSGSLSGWIIPLLFLWAMGVSRFVAWVFSSHRRNGTKSDESN